MNKLYEQIDLARKFGDGKVGVTESLGEKQQDKTSLALGVAKRLSEAKPEPIVPTQLTAFPVSN